jgi:ubiquinone/menaquinone biosynthesis C-methylase UbiE
MKNNLEYFDSIAEKQPRYRKKRSYYWDSITKYCDYYIHPELSVLEIGCGTGDLLAKLRATDKTGIDFSPKMIEIAQKQYPEITFEVMDANNLSLDRKYDVIVISNLIGFLDDVQSSFEQLHKVCHDQTKIIVTYYNFVWQPFIRFAEWIKIKRKAPEQNWMSNMDIENLLYLAGFDVYKQNRQMLIPFRIPLISYLFNVIISRLPLINYLALNQYLMAKKMPISKVEPTKSVSIVIPARNESGNIEQALLRMPKFASHLEIIFVEGNSTDDTWQTIQDIQKKYQDRFDIKILQQPGKGKADAVRTGYAIATGDVLMILDADLTVPPETLPKFYDALMEGKGDFINGCRLIYPMEKGAMRPLNVLGNKFFSMAFTWLLEQPIKDTLCGTKVMYRADYLRLLKNQSYFGNFDPFGDFDLIFGAYKLNLKIIDLPIRYAERTYGSTNISRFRHGFILLKMSIFALKKIKFWN